MWSSFENVARKYIIMLGKCSPFVFIASVVVSLSETLTSIIVGFYAEYNDSIVYYKPLSWFIGEYFSLDFSRLAMIAVISIGIRACVWNKLGIIYRMAVLCQREYFLYHTVSEESFTYVLVVNIIVGLFILYKGLRKII